MTTPLIAIIHINAKVTCADITLAGGDISTTTVSVAITSDPPLSAFEALAYVVRQLVDYGPSTIYVTNESFVARFHGICPDHPLADLRGTGINIAWISQKMAVEATTQKKVA